MFRTFTAATSAGTVVGESVDTQDSTYRYSADCPTTASATATAAVDITVDTGGATAADRVQLRSERHGIWLQPTPGHISQHGHRILHQVHHKESGPNVSPSKHGFQTKTASHLPFATNRGTSDAMTISVINPRTCMRFASAYIRSMTL